MSQYLNFYIRKIDTPELKVCLGWYSTTPARSFSNMGVFPYTENLQVLTKEQIISYQTIIEETITKNKENLKDWNKEVEDNLKLLTCCTTQLSFDGIQQEISILRNSIYELQGDIEELNEWLNHVNFCLTVLMENEGWEFCYDNY